MVLEGENAVSNNRKLMGATDQKMLKKIQLENFLEFQLIKTQCMVQTQLKMQKKR